MTDPVTDSFSWEFAGYRILSKLGSGGSSNVFLALQEGVGGFAKLVVLKRLKGSQGQDALLEEARLLSRLNHPNVVQTLQVLQQGGHGAMVVEHLPGRVLSDLLSDRRCARTSWQVLLRVLLEVLDGLAYVHKAKDHNGRSLDLVHGDISPENVMVTYDGRVKVLDFGLATLRKKGTARRGLQGKLRYLAPEQLLGDPPSPQADIYAVGVVLWEILAGERPWADKTPEALRHEILAGRVPCPRSCEPSIPEELLQLCRKAMAYSPEDRFQGAGEFATAIRNSSEVGSTEQLSSFMVAEYRTERAAMEKQVAKLVGGRTSRVVPSGSGRGGGRAEPPLWRLLALAMVGFGGSILAAEQSLDPPSVDAPSASLASRARLASGEVPAYAGASPVLALKVDSKRGELPGSIVGRRSPRISAVATQRAVVSRTQPKREKGGRGESLPRSVSRRDSPPSLLGGAPKSTPLRDSAPESKSGSRGVGTRKSVPRGDRPGRGCEPPYEWIDGIKRFKIDCLRERSGAGTRRSR